MEQISYSVDCWATPLNLQVWPLEVHHASFGEENLYLLTDKPCCLFSNLVSKSIKSLNFSDTVLNYKVLHTFCFAYQPQEILVNHRENWIFLFDRVIVTINWLLFPSPSMFIYSLYFIIDIVIASIALKRLAWVFKPCCVTAHLQLVIVVVVIV